MTLRDDHCSTRSIAKRLCRSPSTINRELKRDGDGNVYDANKAHIRCQARRMQPRRVCKLHRGSALFQVVQHYLHLRWSRRRPKLS